MKCGRCGKHDRDCQCVMCEPVTPDSEMRTELKGAVPVKNPPIKEIQGVPIERLQDIPDSERTVVNAKQARLLTELSHEQLVARCLQLDYDKRHALQQARELVIQELFDSPKLILAKDAKWIPVESVEEVIALITEPEGN